MDDPNDLESYPPFIFDIFDEDKEIFDSTPDFLCRAVVEPEDCNITMLDDDDKFKEGTANEKKGFEEVPPKPRWHPCYYSPGQP